MVNWSKKTGKKRLFFEFLLTLCIFVQKNIGCANRFGGRMIVRFAAFLPYAGNCPEKGFERRGEA
jgi:hypothetical protein